MSGSTIDENNIFVSAIFDKVRTTYLDLSYTKTNSDILTFFSHNPIKGNHAVLNDVENCIRQYVTMNSDIIDSISIYYKTNNIELSSNTGLKYLDLRDDEPLSNLEWIKVSKQDISEGWQWALLPVNNTKEKTIALVGGYPWSYNDSLNDSMIAIYIKNEALNNILARLSQSPGQFSLILNRDGKVIASSGKNVKLEWIGKNPSAQHMVSDTSDYNFFTGNINNNKYFISYCTVPSIGCQLIRGTPIQNFYQRSQYIQRMLIVIFFICFFIGLILSNILSFKAYNPIKLLTNKVHKLICDEPQLNKQDEYKVINGAITNLSVKLGEYKNILDVNHPIICNNLVINLLNANVKSKDELKEYLKLMQIDFLCAKFIVLILFLDKKVICSMSIKDQQYIKYHLTDLINNYSDNKNLVMCAALDNITIGIIFNSDNENYAREFIFKMSSYIKESLGIRFLFAYGDWVSNPLHINKSFEYAKRLARYRYFIPLESTVIPHDILERDNSKEKMPKNMEEQFAQALNSRHLEEAQNNIRQFIDMAMKGSYEANYCTARLMKLCQILIDFASKLNYQPMENVEDILSQPLKYLWNISEFYGLSSELIRNIFNYSERMSNSHNIEMIESLKNYICKNLNKPLSLDFLADTVHLNPKYLSRIFKELTNENLTDFIISKRMERASELLLNTNMSVEKIGTLVGYNNSSYFIRRFKETYGYSPKNYKIMMKKS